MTHLKPRRATKPLYQGDDMARLAELALALDVAKRRAAGASGAERLGDDVTAGVNAAQAAYDGFLDEAAERAVNVSVQHIGRRRFAALVEAHPPREIDSEPDVEGKTKKVEHPEDAGYGVNTATFPRALLTFRDGDYMTLVEPEFNTQRDVEDFIDDELAEGEYDEFWIAAYMLNRGPSADPKALHSGASPNDSLSTDAT